LLVAAFLIIFSVGSLGALSTYNNGLPDSDNSNTDNSGSASENSSDSPSQDDSSLPPAGGLTPKPDLSDTPDTPDLPNKPAKGTKTGGGDSQESKPKLPKKTRAKNPINANHYGKLPDVVIPKVRNVVPKYESYGGSIIPDEPMPVKTRVVVHSNYGGQDTRVEPQEPILPVEQNYGGGF